MNTENPNDTINRLIRDMGARREAARRSHLLFFNIYFPHYVVYPTADFQKEMFTLTEDESISALVVVAFRGSGKSTIMTLSYPLWAVLGRQQAKFVLLLAKTQAQAKQYMRNIEAELEGNDLLKSDLGPFHKEDEWNASSLVIPKYGARITAASMEQGIRGIRHGSHRPDLIILDDIDDLSSVKTLENREKTYQWLKGDVIPLGDRETRLAAIGNLLHDDSMIMRLKAEIGSGAMSGRPSPSTRRSRR